MLDVFRASGRAVPVFIDKHLSYSRTEAEGMVKAAAAQKVPLMAGSSLPVTWRLPQLEVPLGRKFHEVVVASRGDLEIFGFHALETLQCMAERRDRRRQAAGGGRRDLPGGRRRLGGRRQGRLVVGALASTPWAAATRSTPATSARTPATSTRPAAPKGDVPTKFAGPVAFLSNTSTASARR